MLNSVVFFFFTISSLQLGCLVYKECLLFCAPSMLPGNHTARAICSPSVFPFCDCSDGFCSVQKWNNGPCFRKESKYELCNMIQDRAELWYRCYLTGIKLKKKKRKKKSIVSTLQKKPPIVAEAWGNETCGVCPHPAALLFSEKVKPKT